jgi:hypothetical protein
MRHRGKFTALFLSLPWIPGERLVVKFLKTYISSSYKNKLPPERFWVFLLSFSLLPFLQLQNTFM